MPTPLRWTGLTKREFRAGYAEVVKYGLIGDYDFSNGWKPNGAEVFAGGPARIEAIATSCAAKVRVVVADETEQGERALLNLGHTFGHAFENLTRYIRSASSTARGLRSAWLAPSDFRAISGFARGRSRRASRRI